MKTKTLRDLTLKADKRLIPTGTEVTIAFKTEKRMGIDCDFMEVTLPDGLVIKTNRYTAFFKRPSIRTLEKWTFDSVCKSVTGKRVEPDGHGDDGSPSWLLAMGMI